MKKLTHGDLVFDVFDSHGRETDDQADGAATVVLLHGFPQTSLIWSDVTAQLLTAGVRVVAIDQRGYSAQARPQGRKQYRLSLLAEDIAHLCRELESGPVHLVGHDWGALVAWQVAINNPELLRSLTTVSVPHPAAFLRSMLSSKQFLRSWYICFFQLPALPEWIARSMPRVFAGLLRVFGMQPTQIAEFRRSILDTGSLTGALNWYRALPYLNLRTFTSPVAVPTAHIWGEGDIALDRRGGELTGRYVEAEFSYHVIPASGHWLPETHAREVAEAIKSHLS